MAMQISFREAASCVGGIVACGALALRFGLDLYKIYGPKAGDKINPDGSSEMEAIAAGCTRLRENNHRKAVVFLEQQKCTLV